MQEECLGETRREQGSAGGKAVAGGLQRASKPCGEGPMDTET